MKITSESPITQAQEDAALEILDSAMNKSQKMKRLYALGFNISYIAFIMDVRYNFVYNVVKTYSVQNKQEVEKKIRPSTKELILSLFTKGQSYIDICRALHVNYCEVGRTLKEIGV